MQFEMEVGDEKGIEMKEIQKEDVPRYHHDPAVKFENTKLENKQENEASKSLPEPLQLLHEELEDLRRKMNI